MEKKYTARVLHANQQHDQIERDKKDKDGVLVVVDGKQVKEHKRGQPNGKTVVQVGVFDREGCLKYSITGEAKATHTKASKNSLLTQAINEYKATLMAAGESVPEVTPALEE